MSHTPKIPARGKFCGAVLAAATIACLGLPADRAAAMDAMLSFKACTHNSDASVEIAEAQMSVKVSNPASNQVRFDLFNTGMHASSIARVYFDDNALLSNLMLVDADNGGNPGVDFSSGGAPPVLPGGMECQPPFSVDLHATADPDPPQKGVNPGEFLGIVFDLTNGTSYEDVLADLETGALRVGIHVIAFANGKSEGLVSMWNGTTTEVPEPGTLAMFGFGITGLVVARRRKRTSVVRN